MGDNNNKSKVLNEALRRIEQAKLYEALLNHDLFSEDSASPEIVEVVREEIAEFIQTRLEVLLGIRKESAQKADESALFSEDEVMALRALAARALGGQSKPVPTNPTIIPVVSQSKPAKRNKKSRQQEDDEDDELEYQTPKKPRSANVSQMAVERPDGTKKIIETDYSQAVNPNNPPVGMPSQAQIDMMHARQAEENMRGASMTTPVMGNTINSVLSAAQRNPNIREE